jgi:ParB-like chromosome segregation protein Spo0J
MTAETPSPFLIRQAPLASIERDPDQPRKKFEPSSLEELAADIWLHGLTQPISVTPGEEGSSVIFIGERRFRAFRLNQERAARLLAESSELPEDHPAHRYQDWTVIPVIDVEPMAADVRLLRQLSENDRRDDLSLYERALAITKAVALSGLKGKEFAARHGIPTSLQSTCKGLANAKGPTKLALERGLVQDAHAAHLFQQLPADLQEDLIEQATEEETVLTRIQLRKILDRVLEADQKAELAAGAKGAQDREGPRAGGEPSPAVSKPSASSPASSSGPFGEGPVLSLDALLWLHQHLEGLGPQEDDPLRGEALEAFSEAILRSSAFILVRESFVDRGSPPGAAAPEEVLGL